MVHQTNSRRYQRIERERDQPFFDLMGLIHPMQHPRILHLGCGNGSLTKILHTHFRASYTLGVDGVKDILTHTQHLKTPQLNFQKHEIESFHSHQSFHLIFSYAAIQSIPDHPSLFKKWTKLLVPGGQLAIQMPAYLDDLPYTIASELALEEPFKQLAISLPHVLKMEEYAQLLEQLEFESQVVRLQMYAHFLESTASVVEWVKESLLVHDQAQLEPALYAQFVKEYQKRLIARLGWAEPFFFLTKSLFLWGQLPLDKA